MAHIEITGVEEWAKQFEELSDEFEKICSKALYDGAGIVADEVDKSIDEIPPESFFSQKPDFVNKEREDLHKGLVVGKHIHKNGDIETYVDFAGYNFFVLGNDATKGKSRLRDYYGQGTPIRLIARSICRGVSKGNIHRKKDDFIKRAYRNSKDKAEKSMAKKVDDLIGEIFKNK